MHEVELPHETAANPVPRARDPGPEKCSGDEPLGLEEEDDGAGEDVGGVEEDAGGAVERDPELAPHPARTSAAHASSGYRIGERTSNHHIELPQPVAGQRSTVASMPRSYLASVWRRRPPGMADSSAQARNRGPRHR
jgi:hypothetical protein